MLIRRILKSLILPLYVFLALLIPACGGGEEQEAANEAIILNTATEVDEREETSTSTEAEESLSSVESGIPDMREEGERRAAEDNIDNADQDDVNPGSDGDIEDVFADEADVETGEDIFAEESIEDATEETSDVTEETPDEGERTSDVTEESTEDATEESTEDATEEISDVTEETPDEGEETPDEGEETPDEGEETPDEGEETPDEGEEIPDEGEETSDKVVGLGANCSSQNTICEIGLECVRSNAAAQHIEICLEQVEIGQSCGPGVAGCVDGAGCNWEGPSHLARTCYPDLAEGQVCNGYGSGDCVAGTSCVQTLPGDPTLICKPTVGVGEACGALAGVDCHSGLSCNYATSIQDHLCFPFQQEGEPCGIGAGECVSGTSCQFASLTALFPTCIGNSGIGEECSTEGKGLCNDDAKCLLTSIDGPSICEEKTTLNGESCGKFGQAPCVSGTECLVDEIGGDTGSCYQDEGTQNANCGVTYGWCDEAEDLGCEITNSDLFTGTCKPKAPVFGACGALEEGAPACSATDELCTCSSPFVDYTAGYSDTECAAAGYQEVCVPEVELYDFCAVNTGLDGFEAQNGWLGLCPEGTTCSVALGINGGEVIQASVDTATSYYFQCKTLVGPGETCGQRFACDTGYECQCSPGTVCTVFENMTGDLGTCQVATP